MKSLYITFLYLSNLKHKDIKIKRKFKDIKSRVFIVRIKHLCVNYFSIKILNIQKRHPLYTINKIRSTLELKALYCESRVTNIESMVAKI